MEVVLTKVGIFGFLLGLVLGSFCLALADRSLTNKSFWGRSYCPHCKKTLRWYDLFPILSFLILQGRCRYCREKISIEYLVVEVILGVIIGYLFFQTFFVFELILKTFFIVVLAVLFITDLRKMFIPDRIIKPALLIGLIFQLLTAAAKIGLLYYSLSQTTLGRLLLPPHSDYFQRHALIIGQAFGVSLLMAILIGSFFMALIIITRGKGMGGGDVKLGAFIGLMLGFPQSILAIILSFLIGAVFSIFLIITGKKHFGQSIPFGPFLVLGSLITLFWGSQIIDWYLHLGT